MEIFKNKLVLLNCTKYDDTIFGMRNGGRFTNDFVCGIQDPLVVTDEKNDICEVIPFADGIGLYNCNPCYFPKCDLGLVRDYTKTISTRWKHFREEDLVFLDPKWFDDIFSGNLMQVFDVTSSMIRIGDPNGNKLFWIHERYFCKQDMDCTYNKILNNYTKKD